MAKVKLDKEQFAIRAHKPEVLKRFANSHMANMDLENVQEFNLTRQNLEKVDKSKSHSKNFKFLRGQALPEKNTVALQ